MLPKLIALLSCCFPGLSPRPLHSPVVYKQTTEHVQKDTDETIIVAPDMEKIQSPRVTFKMPTRTSHTRTRTILPQQD